MNLWHGTMKLWDQLIPQKLEPRKIGHWTFDSEICRNFGKDQWNKGCSGNKTLGLEIPGSGFMHKRLWEHGTILGEPDHAIMGFWVFWTEKLWSMSAC